MRNLNTGALALLIALGLAACGGEPGATRGQAGAAPAPSSKTLADAIGDARDLGAMERVVDNAGLSEVLEGKGPYTVFAPDDAAFAPAGADLSGPAMKAQSAALLRAHIVPGALTRADIVAAIEAGGGKGVQMRTMADGLLTFTRDGETVVVTAGDSAMARLSGDERVVANGVVQPVNGVLVKAE